MPARAIRRVLIILGYLAIAGQVLLVAARPTHYQWDFRAYYFGADVALAGANPYDPSLLGKTMAESGLTDGKVFPFVYPPHAILEFAPLTLVPFMVAYYIYLAIKIIAICVVLVVGASWLDGWWRTSWPLLVSLMFGGAIGMDLRDGNLGLLESALVLLAIVALTRGRPGIFGGLVAVASSWKLALLPIISLGFAGRSRSALRGVVVPLSVIAAVLVLDRVLRPDLWNGFRETSSGLLQDIQRGPLRGELNSSLLRLLGDVSDLALGRIEPVIVISTYFAITLMIAMVTILTIARRRNVPLLPVCVYGLLAYGLVVPRLIPYSLVLLIAPTVYVLNKCIRPWGGAAVAAFSSIPFFYLGRLAGTPDEVPTRSFFLLPLEYVSWLTIAICWVAITYTFVRKQATFEKLTNRAGPEDVDQHPQDGPSSQDCANSNFGIT